MGQFLKIFGAISTIIVVTLTLIVVAVIVIGHALDKQSKAYAQAVVRQIASNWDEQALTSQMSSEFIAATSPTQLDQFFRRARQLGRMSACNPLQGQAFFSLTTWSGRSVTATYAVECHFQQGAARIRISLIKHNGEWRIAGFNVTPTSSLPTTPAISERQPVLPVRPADQLFA